jgi:nucleoside-diphosphate-sugar epimerase
MKTLITGGAGFIGTHLAQRLVDRSDVVLLDNFRRNSLASVPELREDPRVEVQDVDILDADSVAKVMADVDVVVHLAAIAGVSSYYNESLRTLQVNILGTNNVLEQAAAHGVSSFVHFSTSEVFGPDALWVNEESGFNIGPVSDRRWVYATSKLAGEQLTLRYGEKFGMRSTVLRPFNVYGPRQTGEGAIANFCTAALTGTPLKVYGDGTPIRAWCHVDDMVAAVLAVLETPEAAGETFNIGNPAETETTLGLARRVRDLVPGSTIEFEAVDRAEVRSRVPDIAKARRLLGFEPQVDLATGLAQTLAWVEQQVVRA